MAEDFAADLDRMQAACLEDLKEAMPRSELGRALMAELAAEDARERASRSCHNCVHFAFGTVDDGTVYQPWDRPEVSCFEGHLGERNIVSHEARLREVLRTAASCPDYEEVDDSEEGVEG